MTAWWDALTGLQQGIALFAIPGTVLLLIQIILLIFGLGDDSSFDTGVSDTSGLDGDFSHDGDISLDHDLNDASFFSFGGLRLLTVRGVTAFLAVGGWMALWLLDIHLTPWLAIPLGLIAGVFASMAIAYALKAAMKLESSGNINLQNAVGLMATVYLPIPAGHAGAGKVTLTIQERFSEFRAVTDHNESIPTGQLVTVRSVVDGDTLVVVPASVPSPAKETEKVVL